MAVTELALLHFKAQEDPSVKTGLVQAQQAQEEHSKHKVHFLREVKDPSRFYLLAGWDSLETHIAQQVHYQGQLVQLADLVGVDWMFHLDADPSTFAIPFEAPIIAIGRYFIEASNEEKFNTVFKAIISHLATTAITPFSCCGAWRIDKGEDEEYVFFSVWKEI
ncbi:uncharacterized protein N7446_006930 [Penicillium canescens]|uniref:ABM domain-containing protein n=1 Tax=Penicillium canescens TaxID=5083 RepID=A0AAD6NE15_PENCN|nr:uncharacterized protein N7446_006930 [Penicillium canescens]KAJ6049742.1 hypothetical protein N7444_006458 [Penicillium canescens]KAJ6052287.1 hypothetical protein N7460_002821 [Penicillium canescens]KAJ6062810.1 hypothetical protein N7446_006930 [Penicillium canescens]